MDSSEVIRRWAERSGEFSPSYYAYYGPNETSERIRGLLDSVVGREATVLELGCSSGRHLSHLHDHGYEDLHGIDVNDEAFRVMEETAPELAARVTFHADAIESVVTDFDDDRFDAVFSVETLQHVHPDNGWVFGELPRIARDLLVTVEHEGRSDRDGEDGPEGESDRGRAEGAGDDGRRRSGVIDVNYVNGEFPLYYRDWGRIFAELGLTEIESEPVGRDTLRAFRPPRK
ncbi:class I SAM-dependent methyltransferase [Halomarina halobia]|uniref:Class I SAM-dependent methyltransferase n=1 Tax=Halomarina halobia TaxID=3033386 RepID=A0ABD6A5B7_9EURY|nr:class I SAM-dependent methyltransferase [Halomarina sp. PSR21]